MRYLLIRFNPSVPGVDKVDVYRTEEEAVNAMEYAACHIIPAQVSKTGGWIRNVYSAASSEKLLYSYSILEDHPDGADEDEKVRIMINDGIVDEVLSTSGAKKVSVEIVDFDRDTGVKEYYESLFNGSGLTPHKQVSIDHCEKEKEDEE